jgi:NADPH:quinone reductase-like Zn-dependent oxidoreductase
LARASSATVFGTSRTLQKLERAKELGLDIPLSAQDFADRVQALTNGEGVQLILDFVGAAYLQQNLTSLADWGRLVMLGTMGGTTAEIDLRVVMSKRIQLRGSTLRSRSLEEKLTVTRRFAKQVIPLFTNQRIQPIISEMYPLAEIAKAHLAMSANNNFGKVVLSIP